MSNGNKFWFNSNIRYSALQQTMYMERKNPFQRVFDELYNHHNIISFDTMPSEQVFKNSINKLMSSKEVIKIRKIIKIKLILIKIYF